MGCKSYFRASLVSHSGCEFEASANRRLRASSPASFNWTADNSRHQINVLVLIMTRACLILTLLLPLPAMASTFTVTAPHLTMHVGDPVPPLIFNVSAYSGSYASHFSGEPVRSTMFTLSVVAERPYDNGNLFHCPYCGYIGRDSGSPRR